MWMVRAGLSAGYIEEFWSKSVFAIGWAELGEIPAKIDKLKLNELVNKTYPHLTANQVGNWTGQIYRFINEIQHNDYVISYNPGTRQYYLGKIVSECFYDPNILGEELPRCRKVEWLSEQISRDALAESARNSLGAISTLFSVRADVSEQIIAIYEGTAVKSSEPPESMEETNSEHSVDLVYEQNKERIKDYIVQLSWDELQELSAGLLRAMGYKTRIAAKGPDRGVDIIASPDGLGLQEPRIFVECKHRKDRVDAPMLRSFLGGRHERDKCLYVSTGGFTQDARYEAERSKISITLVDMEYLVEMILSYYSSFDNTAKKLLPLKPIYWLDNTA
jgi:restriction system protein